MVTNIRRQLQNENFRFALLKKNEKNPIPGVKWGEINYKYNDKELLEHNGNYGVIGGYGKLRIIDIDNQELGKKLLEFFNTFTVQTIGGNYHFYIICDYAKNSVFKNNLGEFRADNYYVVGPDCYAEDKKKGHKGTYVVLKDVDIRNISEEELFKLIGPLLKEHTIIKDIQIVVDKDFLDKNVLPKILDNKVFSLITQIKTKEELTEMGFPSRSERDQRVITTLLLNGFGQYIKSVFDLYPVGDKYKEHPDGVSYLEHSIRGGREYSGVEDDRIPNLEKEINNINESILRNKLNYFLDKISEIDDWMKRTQLLSMIAFKIKLKTSILEKRLNEIINTKNQQNLQKPIPIFNLLMKENEEIRYYINSFLPKNYYIGIIGKPGQFKSLLALYSALCIATKQKFLNSFNIQNSNSPKILLYDLENGEQTTSMRLKYIVNGMNLDKNLNQKLLENFGRFEKFDKINISNEFIKAKDYDIIILDSYRRFLKGTEDKSEITDDFYMNFLKPLKDLGKTIIIIFHTKKIKLSELDDEDFIDIIRGSGDIGAQLDLAYTIMKRKEFIGLDGKTSTFEYNIKVVKNRDGLPINDFNFKVTKDDINLKTVLNFDGYGRQKSPKQRRQDSILNLIKETPNVERKLIISRTMEIFECSEITVVKDLEDMINDGILEQEVYGKYKIKG